ncbi:MAG: CoA transferase [Flavobacteriales bacterium]|nr:CoA transferase [Flavobacteriales bacterium]
MNNKPLSGLKVLELASVLAGPAVGTFLAELGAEVIKIENPTTGGDVTRSWKLTTEDADSDLSGYFASVNYGKQHRFLDLKDADELAEVQQLARESDIIIANFRKGQAERFGLDFEALRQQNPKLIYGNITGFGAEESRPAFDVVLQAETGYMYMNGQPDSDPTKMPVALIDVLAAHQLKEAVLLALLEREKRGEGALVEVSLFDAAVSALTNQASNWLMNGHIPQRIGSLHPNIAPYGEILTTKDEKQIVLAIGSNAQFRALCEVLGLDELPDDPAFETNQLRVENRTVLHQQLQSNAAQLGCDDLMKQFLEKNIPAGVIRNLKEVFQTEAASELVNTEGETKRVSQIAFKIRR